MEKQKYFFGVVEKRWIKKKLENLLENQEKILVEQKRLWKWLCQRS